MNSKASYVPEAGGPAIPGCHVCREEGRSRLLLPGILIHIGRGTMIAIERCDSCAIYETDEDALQAFVDAAERELLEARA